MAQRLSARIPPDTVEAMRSNMMADGLSRAATSLVAVTGVADARTLSSLSRQR